MLVTAVSHTDVIQHGALIGVALAVRNLHTIHLHLPRHGRASHESVGGTRRRNVLGAIAREKNDRNSPLQRRLDESQANTTTEIPANSDHFQKNRRLRAALPVRNYPRKNHSHLTNSFRKGPPTQRTNASFAKMLRKPNKCLSTLTFPRPRKPPFVTEVEQTDASKLRLKRRKEIQTFNVLDA